MHESAHALPLIGLLLLAGCQSDWAVHMRGVNCPGPVTALDVEPESAAPNRDRHGPEDIAHYILSLESVERVAELRVEEVLTVLAPPGDAIIGDLGCGPGVMALPLARACPAGTIYAADVEPAQLDRLSQHARHDGLRNIVPVLASQDNPHFPVQSLDYVFCVDTYHHLERRINYMQRLRGAFKPGGRLVVIEYKSGDLPVGPPADHKLPEGKLDVELEEAGYTLVERYEFHPYHDFAVWRAIQPWER